MKYYKDINGSVFAYELDGSQDHLIGDKVTMTAEEVDAHINPPKTAEQIQADLIAHFKSLYLGVFDAKRIELDYDSMATLEIWSKAVGSKYELEAKAMLAWYIAIINYNDGIMALGTIPTDEEYLAQMPVYGA